MHVACPRCSAVLEFSNRPPAFCSQCGQPLPPPDQLATAAFVPGEAGDAAPPQAVGGYRLLRRLGGGGMGSVYEAEEAASGRRVAVKLIAPEYAESPEAVQRFRQEGRLASAIAHPRCVFVLAADEEAGQPYIVMELMPGATLEGLVEERGPLPPEEAVAKALDVIDGLREAHRLGVVHRDVKPSNCFLEADGRVKVGDFGLSKSLGGQARLTTTGAFLGTLLFAPPEQVRGERVDHQSDLYAAAATLYYLLAGRAPFQGGDAAAVLARTVADPVPPLRARRPEVPAALERVVLRGLERDRQRRWRDLDELRAALLPFAPGRLS
ncbi:MAG TPA: serine/threonine-protein kinase, partial [Gemmataceae bacterium]|nr:serine/threonine-protein kinase [Gemmataceae bacterium]